MNLSNIIPVLNEADNLKELLPLFQNQIHEGFLEVIVVDGGSTDVTGKVVEEMGFRFLECGIQSRAVQ